MPLLYTDPLFLRHETGKHPERPARLEAIARRLEASDIAARCTPGTYRPLTEEVVRRVHEPGVVELARETCAEGSGYLDGDTPVCEDSFAVALAAAGACVGAVDAVIKGQDTTALCLVRPPGHHATPTRSMGFCLFNNVALAAHHARTAHDLDRVLVIDWDVHHGNGTQDIFYQDGAVTFLSIHRFGRGFYPGTGDADETGTGPGLGHTVNVPLRYGVPRRDFHGAFANALEKAADRCKPQLVLVSAGFDAHRLDPIGDLGLETEDYAMLTRSVLDVARTHAGGRLISCLEGGYHLDALAESVEAHLTELLAAKG